MDCPDCLHIPVLYEGKPARVAWSAVKDADGYVLERLFDETFEQAEKGRFWAQLDNAGKAWANIEAEGLTWANFESLPAVGRSWAAIDINGALWSEIEDAGLSWDDFEKLSTSFPIYKGMGIRVPGPDQGRTWNQLENSGLNWIEIESSNLDWVSMECLRSVGRTWSQMDNQDRSWLDIEASELAWRDYELIDTQGLSWETVEAHYRAWDDIDAENLTWLEFEKLTDDKDHRAADDQIAFGAKAAIYRIKAYSASGVESEHLTANSIPIVPIFYRDNKISWVAKAGTHYYLMIEGQDIQEVDKVSLVLQYSSSILELVDFSAHNTGKQVYHGISPSVYTSIQSQKSGVIQFKCTKPIKEGETWSGCVTLIDFTAKGSGVAELSIL